MGAPRVHHRLAPHCFPIRLAMPALAICITLLVIVGCGGDGPASPGSPGGPGTGPNPQPTLECDAERYPCSLSQVPLEILERSEALGDAIAEMMSGGASPAAVTAWLEAQPGIAEVAADALTLRFRLDGGRAYWILLEDPLDESRASSRIRPNPASGTLSPSYDVVGPATKQKRALVLSPLLWEFQHWDDGPVIRDILKGTRGYEGGVDYLFNEDTLSTGVGVATFRTWENYQVVHVTSHGRRLCDAAGCRAMIVATNLKAILASGSETEAEAAHRLEQDGLDVSRPADGSGVRYVAVTADFFRSYYKTGLHDTIVLLNACQTFGAQATDLVEAIQGNSSVVLGWDEAVHAAEATAAAEALFTELSEWGYPAEIAYERLGSVKTGTPTDHGPAATLILGKRPMGGDLRVRDVVTLLDPASHQPLTPSSVVGIDGTMGDGEPDGAPYLVRVDGVIPDLATQARLHVAIDGIEADAVPVSIGEVDDHDQWMVRGTAPLGYDLQEEKAATFRAWVELPDGGESDDEVVATVSGDEPIMGHTWELEAVHTSGWTGGIPHTPYTATAHLTLRFAPGQAAAELHPKYVVTGGTVTYDYSHTYYDCSYTAPPITFEVTEGVSQDSHLSFDTAPNPVRYSGVIYTQGPEIQVVESCGDESSTRTQRAANTWLLFNPADAQAVSGDRRSIVGSYRVESGGGFYIESKYTITRID